jgi:hypothetical protein
VAFTTFGPNATFLLHIDPLKDNDVCVYKFLHSRLRILPPVLVLRVPQQISTTYLISS